MTRFVQGLRLNVAAWAFAQVFALGFDLSIGAEVAVGYRSLCAALAGLAAIGMAAVAAPLRTPVSLPLALWVGAHGWLIGGWPTGLVFAGLLACTLAWSPIRGLGWATQGLVAAVCACGSLVVWPRVASRLGTPLEGIPAQIPGILVFAGLLSMIVVWEALRRTHHRLPHTAAVAGLALSTFAVLPVMTRASPGSLDSDRPRGTDRVRPSIVVLLLDTVRADRLSIYGYHRDTTPRLASFIERHEEVVTYPLAHSSSTWTLPAHASLFTGLLASDHGVHAQSALVASGHRAANLQAERTLAEALRSEGYKTACVYSNAWLGRVPGLERGFDWFVQPTGTLKGHLLGELLRALVAPSWYPKEGSGLLKGEAVNAAILDFLGECRPGPCYVFANYLEAHAPYIPSQPFQGAFAAPDAEPLTGSSEPGDSPKQLRDRGDRYDEEILELDTVIGDLIEELESTGALDEIWLVITSDHGEAFGEHGAFNHGSTVYGEVSRVPLLIKPPRDEALRRDPTAVGSIDVAATIANIATGRGIGSGRDLRQAEAEGAPVQIELFPNIRQRTLHGKNHGKPERAVVVGTLKLIESDDEVRKLYDLANDVNEREDLAAEHEAIALRMEAYLPALRQSETLAPEVKLPPEDEAQLRALGYLD